MKIKVVKCSSHNYWYSGSVGKIFEAKIISGQIREAVKVYNVFKESDIEIIKETKMKVVEKFSKSLEVKYPCLKVTTLCDDSSLIVLFTSKNTGIVLKTDDIRYTLGQFDNTWLEENFTLYQGTLEISNGDT